MLTTQRFRTILQCPGPRACCRWNGLPSSMQQRLLLSTYFSESITPLDLPVTIDSSCLAVPVSVRSATGVVIWDQDDCGQRSTLEILTNDCKWLCNKLQTAWYTASMFNTPAHMLSPALVQFLYAGKSQWTGWRTVSSSILQAQRRHKKFTNCWEYIFP